MIAHRALRKVREGGFTLVELIVAVAILGIISVAVGAVSTVMFRSVNQATDRLKETRGARFAAVYWTPDVTSTQSVNPTVSGSPIVCGAANPLVTLRWTDTTTTGVTTVSWAIDTTAGRKLVRRLCTNASTTPTRTTVIAPQVSNPGAAVTCGDGTTYTACSSDDPDKSLLLTVTGKTGTFTVDALREVT